MRNQVAMVPSGLSDKQLEPYVQELRDLCLLARYARSRLRERLEEGVRGRAWYMDKVRRQEQDPNLEYGPYSGIDPYATFYADAVVSLAARISRLIWPSEIRGGASAKLWAERRSYALRAALGIGPERIITPGIRDSIEHYDERLDKVTRDTPESTIFRRNLTDHERPTHDAEYRARVLHVGTLNYQIGPDTVSIEDVGTRLGAVEQAANAWFSRVSGRDSSLT